VGKGGHLVATKKGPKKRIGSRLWEISFYTLTRKGKSDRKRGAKEKIHKGREKEGGNIQAKAHLDPSIDGGSYSREKRGGRNEESPAGGLRMLLWVSGDSGGVPLEKHWREKRGLSKKKKRGGCNKLREDSFLNTKKTPRQRRPKRGKPEEGELGKGGGRAPKKKRCPRRRWQK